MLVISRKKFESIVIRLTDGSEAVITFCGTRLAGRLAKIGIKAPQHVLVLREELVKHDSPPVAS